MFAGFFWGFILGVCVTLSFIQRWKRKGESKHEQEQNRYSDNR